MRKTNKSEAIVARKQRLSRGVFNEVKEKHRPLPSMLRRWARLGLLQCAQGARRCILLAVLRTHSTSSKHRKAACTSLFLPSCPRNFPSASEGMIFEHSEMNVCYICWMNLAVNVTKSIWGSEIDCYAGRRRQILLRQCVGWRKLLCCTHTAGNGCVPCSGGRISPPWLLHQWKKRDPAPAGWCGSGAPYFKWQGLSKVANFLGLIEHATWLLVKPVFG